MCRPAWLGFVCLISLILSAGCGGVTPAPTPVLPTPASNLPNPASVYCEQNGGRLELRTDASGAVSGVCLFPDGSECDEWAYFRGECGPAQPTAAPAEFATPLPIDPAEYEGWWTYTHAGYGFSIRLPEDWVVEEITANNPLLNGHLLWLHPEQDLPGGLRLRLTFRRAGEDTLLWPTGARGGEFVAQGTLAVGGQQARRMLFVCPNGELDSIWYQGEAGPNLALADLELAFILSQPDSDCQGAPSLAGKPLRVAEMIVASLSV